MDLMRDYETLHSPTRNTNVSREDVPISCRFTNIDLVYHCAVERLLRSAVQRLAVKKKANGDTKVEISRIRQLIRPVAVATSAAFDRSLLYSDSLCAFASSVYAASRIRLYWV